MTKVKRPFVDFAAIRAQITMEQVLEHYGVLNTLKRSGSRLSGPCPIHKGSNPTQFRVETDKNLWNCFSDCKRGGNTLDFISKMENIQIHEAALKACEWFGIPLSEVSQNGSGKQEVDESPEEPAKATPRPASKSNPQPPADNKPNAPLKFNLDKNLARSHPYFTERGISQETVIDFGLGYFTGDKGMMVGRIVIPIHSVKGELLGYAGRWPGEPPDKETEKFKLPKDFKKLLEVFNLDRAIKEPADKPLVIVEGFFDAIKLHQHGCRKVVALMGWFMSPVQEELIRQHIKASHIIVMLDEDKAGQEAREEIAGRLAKFALVKIHIFDKRDMQPEHLSAEEVNALIGGDL